MRQWCCVDWLAQQYPVAQSQPHINFCCGKPPYHAAPYHAAAALQAATGGVIPPSDIALYS